MNILISGGFGFIGSYLANYLLSKGHNVGILSRGIPIYFKSFAHRTQVYISDITDDITVKPSTNYDIFIHLAAANDIDSSNTLSALKGTTLGTRNCLEFCVNNNINKFIYFSTFQVYGTDSGLIDENFPLLCKNDYAITHLFAEEYVKMYHRMHALDYIILRPTNVYGAFFNLNIDRWSLVPSCFCLEAFEKKTVTLLSSGKQLRDFISLEDLTKTTSLFCRDFDLHKNDVFNVARCKSISILEVANYVIQLYEEVFGDKCDLNILSDKPRIGKKLIVSTEKIRRLNYKYSTDHTIDKDIRRILISLKENL